ncbi:MAG: hypothetical protein ACE5J3_08445 [Methanosarcinales archaeon]
MNNEGSPCKICPIYKIIKKTQKSEVIKHLQLAEREILLAIRAGLSAKLKITESKLKKVEINWKK